MPQPCPRQAAALSPGMVVEPVGRPFCPTWLGPAAGARPPEWPRGWEGEPQFHCPQRSGHQPRKRNFKEPGLESRTRVGGCEGFIPGFRGQLGGAALPPGDFAQASFLSPAGFLVGGRRAAFSSTGAGVIIWEAVQKSFWSFSCLVSTEGTSVVRPRVGVLAVTGVAERSSRSVPGRGGPVSCMKICAGILAQ